MLEIERRGRRCTMLLLPGRIADTWMRMRMAMLTMGVMMTDDNDYHIDTAYDFCHCYNCTR